MNTVAPSYVQTPELAELIQSGRLPERLRYVVDTATGAIPVRRPGAVADVAATVAFLARDEAGFTTGQVLSVNGGSSMT